MCVELAPDALEKLSDPVFMLRAFIEIEEKLLERSRRELEKEHKSVMAKRATLPISHQPMDAPYWLRRYNEIGRREQALEKARAELRELENNGKDKEAAK